MPISRMFTAAEDASDAVSALKRAGFERAGIHVFARTAEDVSVESIVQQGVSRPSARQYAERINHGETLVVVNAPLGTGTSATAILERAGASSDPGAAEVTYEVRSRDEAAPLSSAFGIRVLSHNPTPLSSWLNMPTLSREQTPKTSSFGMKLLSHKAAPFSSRLGWKVLSRNAAPFSSRFGWRLLSQNATPLSSRFGWKLLSQNAAPLSLRIGWRLLSQNSAPLSSAVGWKLLTDNPAPLSSLLGLKVLSKHRSA